VVVLVVAFVLLCGGCVAAEPTPVVPPPRAVLPAGVLVPAPASDRGVTPECGDPRASLRPTGQPAAGPTIDRIRARGFLVAGVNQNAYRVGYRDPATGELAGFEIDIVRAIADALFGEPGHVRFAAMDAAHRVAALQGGDVDVVVRTMTITCADALDVAFSTEYFTANQRLLVRRGSPVTGIEQLAGQRVCAAAGSTSLDNIRALNPAAVPVSAADVIDCLVMLQQHQIDAISTSDILLVALAAQDPHTALVGPSLKEQPCGVAMTKTAPDLVRFVNAVLARRGADGSWTSAYTRWLSPILGPPPAPPVTRYLPE
jgi:polar amino acid transport system substrate-binding protein